MADSMFYDKERYLEMQAENKRMSHLLGDAEVEAEEVQGRVVELQKALEVGGWEFFEWGLAVRAA